MNKLKLLMILFSFLACKNEPSTQQNGKEPETEISLKILSEKLSYNDQIAELKSNMPNNLILSNDIQFINDSVLNGKFKLDISRYELENKKKGCLPLVIEKEEFYEFSLEGERTTKKEFKLLGDINADKKDDFVFILPSLGECEEGQSYYFTDNNIPRIQTESQCCHIESIFSIGDIDKDGANEIAEYNSSCASNFKIINIWTFKNNKWKLIKQLDFYYDNGKFEAFKDFDKLYKKIAQNKFKFLEISDRQEDGKIIMEWKIIKMN